MNSLKCVVTV